MKIFAGALATETNSFSPVPTSLRSFYDGLYYNGPASEAPLERRGAEALKTWRDRAAAIGADFVLGPIAFAEPSGLTTAPAYAALKSDLLSALAEAGPVDMVLLALHGAMMADGCDDVEGDILASVRLAVGRDVAIGALIDPHAHLTARMVDAATLIAAYHEWPHTDVAARADHLFGLLEASVRGAVRPKPAVIDCRMVASYPTRPQPMRGFVDDMAETEAHAPLLSVNLIHGFPWGDTADTGTKMLVWSDGDTAAATDTARRFADRLTDIREAARLKMDLGMEAAFDLIEQPTEGLLVFCDVGDVVPAGAPGDSTHMLRRAMERRAKKICFGPLWDPMATAVCMEVGPGARAPLRIGGKAGAASGQPVDVMATVRAVLPAGQGGSARQFGDRAWVSLDGEIDIVLHTVRASTEDLAAATDLGIELSDYRAFVGKMLMHGGAAFAPMARAVYSVETPGTLAFPEAAIALSKLKGPWWPKDA